MTKTVNVSWPAKFALMDHFKPSDTDACAVFNVTQDELETARQLRIVGTLSTDRTFDVTKYAPFFASAGKTETSSTVHSNINNQPTPIKGGTMSNKGTATTHTKPETASKKVKVPQKRGRKGDKISVALAAVPTTPVTVDSFITQYGVSLAVLRQSKRFIQKLDTETQATIGQVNVRQDKATKQLMIWRS